MKCGETVDSLISAIYPSLDVIDPAMNNDPWFLERTILCPKNDAVDDLNTKCLNVLRGNIL
ncbi:hypothetical protein EV360DRAFT_58524, partial [Lentinula raphanica]